MRPSKTAIITILIILGFALIAGIAIVRLDLLHRTPTETDYKSGAINFTYPVGYDIEEQRNGSVAIGRLAEGVFTTSVMITKVESEEGSVPESPEAFFRAQAQLQCEESGAACEAAGEARSFNTANGGFAFEFPFTAAGQPFSVFAVPTTPGADTAYEGFLIFAPLNAVPEGEEVPGELARKVLDTVTVN